jgi:hypothetical protein
VVELDPDMRLGDEYYSRDYRNFISDVVPAEATTLSDHSFDFATAGQAFHWFHIEKARNKFMLALVPSGWVVLNWNVRKPAGSPFLNALQQFWHAPRFGKPSR